MAHLKEHANTSTPVNLWREQESLLPTRTPKCRYRHHKAPCRRACFEALRIIHRPTARLLSVAAVTRFDKPVSQPQRDFMIALEASGTDASPTPMMLEGFGRQ